jgi:hypothetical protein
MTTTEAKSLIAEQLSRFAAEPDTFPAALAARARMPHRYSVSNMLLILRQANDPDVLADRIMPRTEWIKEGFTVRGVPLAIWSHPFIGHRFTDGTVTFHKTERETATDGHDFAAFRLVATYPAAQAIDGDGHAATATGKPLTGEAGELYGRLSGWLTRQGWRVEERNVDRAGGWTSHAEQVIRIDPRFTGWDRLRVLVHEATHALEHAHLQTGEYDAHRGDFEAEADGVAFAVLSAYGQAEAAARTVAYVANWEDGNTDLVQAAIDRASAALDAILDVLAGADDVTVRTIKASKAENKALAAWLRDNGLPANGPVWTAAKTGERDLDALRALVAA